MEMSSDKLKKVVPASRLPQPSKGKVVADDQPGGHASFISPQIITGLARFLEFIILSLTGIGLALVYPGVHSGLDFLLYVILALVLSGIFMVVLQIAGGYSLRHILHPLTCVSTALMSWVILLGATSFFLVAAKEFNNFSRIWLVLWFFSGAFELILFRFSFSSLVHHWDKMGQLKRRAVIVGGGEPAYLLHQALKGSPESDINIIGIFDDRDDIRSPRNYDGIQKLGNISQLIDYVRTARVDLLLVTLPPVAEERVLQIVKRLWVLPVDIRICAQNQKLRYQPRAYSYLGNVPFLDVFDKPLDDWDIIIKNIEDKIISALALVFLSPLMLFIALLIKLDSKGPVIFKQMRYGFNNELIEVYKFRSMEHSLKDAHADKLVTRDDPRVTRIGKILRRTSLDELPQFFNVLAGTLSLVGPRPHATRAKAAEMLYTEVVDGYFARHKVKPGITGWAQINGWRGETDTIEKLQRRIEHDIYYIENWSLLFDLYILIRTPFALVKGENAY